MKKFWLYFHTIRYLKAQQAFYLLWYKAKKHFPLKESYSKYNQSSLHRLRFDDYDLIPSEGKFLKENTFCFLNLQHQFKEEIDWAFSEHGKLWNYNLQYFDFIFDEHFSPETYIPIIENFAAAILKNKLPLEPYPVSLRLINWLLFFSKTGYDTPDFQKAIKLQTAFLEKNLEVHLLGNHYFENLVTLFVVALYLMDEKLLAKATKKLKVQLNEQILKDGGHHECSPMYHTILLSRLLLIYRLLQCNDLSTEIQPLLEKTISKMQGWLQAFSFKDGSYAKFNDATENIAVDTKTINRIFQKTKLAVELLNLKESGYRKFSNDNFEMIVDVGNIIPAFQPGHAHSDMLSFVLNFQGKEIFIDPGISTYEVNEQRLLERGTLFHNTVSINKENQSEVWASFRVAKRAELRLKNDELNFCCASHNGYKKRFGIEHERTFIFREKEIEIVDQIECNNAISATAHFYFAPTLLLIQKDEKSVAIGEELMFSVDDCYALKIHSVIMPDGYNNFVAANKIEVAFRKNLHTRIFVLG